MKWSTVALMLLAWFAPLAAADPVPGDTITATQAREMIRDGNAQVLPTLQRWLDLGLLPQINNRSADERLLVAIEGVGQLGVNSAGPTLVSVYRNSNGSIRNTIARAAAQVGTSGSRKFLQELQDDPSLSPSAQIACTVALVRLGDDDARDRALQAYKDYLVDITTKSSWNGMIRSELETIYDLPLMAKIESLGVSETDQRAKNNVTTLLARMEINSFGVDQLFSIAENSVWREVYDKRYAAIAALGEKATPDDIARLDAIRPWDSVDFGATAIQQKFLIDYKAKAISRIRQRNVKSASK